MAKDMVTVLTDAVKLLGERGAFVKYNNEVNKLVERLSTKMKTFATSGAEMATSNEELKRSLADLNTKFSEKSQEVDGLVQKVGELEKAALARGTEFGEQLGALRDELQKLRDELEQKSREAADLSEKHAAVSATARDASAVSQDVMDAYEALEKDFSEISRQLDERNKRVTELELQVQKGTKTTDPVVSHTKHNGEFDLVEHLATALKKSKTKKVWGDW
jgi:chromosome segregation ATPase